MPTTYAGPSTHLPETCSTPDLQGQVLRTKSIRGRYDPPPVGPA